MAKFIVYEKVSGKPHRCEGADVKELTEGAKAFYTKVEPETNAAGADKPNERINAIVEAIKILERDNEAHFTANGLPRDAAIEDLLGYKVSKEERAEAWNEVQSKEEAGK